MSENVQELIAPTQRAGMSIQWKGTDACLDFHCECGAGGHIDGYFANAVECSQCARKYSLSTNVELLPYSGTHARLIISPEATK